MAPARSTDGWIICNAQQSWQDFFMFGLCDSVDFFCFGGAGGRGDCFFCCVFLFCQITVLNWK